MAVEAVEPTATSTTSSERGRRQVKTGIVISDKMDKTVVIQVQVTYMHPLYHRYVKRSKKFAAHDEENQCNVGDTITIVSTRPISKRKCWRVQEILKRAE